MCSLASCFFPCTLVTVLSENLAWFLAHPRVATDVSEWTCVRVKFSSCLLVYSSWVSSLVYSLAFGIWGLHHFTIRWNAAGVYVCIMNLSKSLEFVPLGLNWTQWVLSCFHWIGISFSLTLSSHIWESAYKQERGPSSLLIPVSTACGKSLIHPSSVERHGTLGCLSPKGKCFGHPSVRRQLQRMTQLFNGVFGEVSDTALEMLRDRQHSHIPGSSNSPPRHVAANNFTFRFLLLSCWKSLAF